MTDETVFGQDDTADASAPAPAPAPSPQPAGSGSGSGNGDRKGDSGPGSNAGVPAAGGGVNPMILDAVKQSNSTVLGALEKNGASIAYQKVAQAASLAVQDSTDYLRNVMAMASAATGVALKKMVETPATAEQYKPVLEAATKAVTDAQTNFDAVGKSAGTVVSGFPNGT